VYELPRSEFTEAYISDVYGASTGATTLDGMAVGPDAFNVGCQSHGASCPYDSLTPDEKTSCREEDAFNIGNMENLLYLCGESRLWGGMHFSASVPAGNNLCGGFGAEAYDLVKVIFNRVKKDWEEGDPRPICNQSCARCPYYGSVWVDSDVQ
jgi:hypothetical protein